MYLVWPVNTGVFTPPLRGEDACTGESVGCNPRKHGGSAPWEGEGGWSHPLGLCSPCFRRASEVWGTNVFRVHSLWACTHNLRGCVHVARQFITMRLPPRLVDRADALAQEKGITRTRVVELALINLLEPVVAAPGRRVPVGAAERQARLNAAKGL